MRKTTLILIAISALAAYPGAASAQGDRFSLGAVVGDPTGITGKLWTGGNNAVDFAAAWSTSHEDAAELHADWIHHDFGVFSVQNGALPLYYGIGGRMILADQNRAGARFPLGISYLTERRNLEFFLEVAPALDLVPDTEFDLGAGVGFRFMLP